MIASRSPEMDALLGRLSEADSGLGSAILVTGEAGMGKTWLVNSFLDRVNGRKLVGKAAGDGNIPFLVFSDALSGLTDEPLFDEEEHTGFMKVMAINSAGLLVAQAGGEGGDMDSDIFAGMLAAVQDFVRDSIGGKGGIGRMEYGDLKIILEHGKNLFLVAVLRGAEHQDMASAVRNSLDSMERNHGELLTGWGGKVADMEPIRRKVEALAGKRYLVRRELGGINLKNERLRISNLILNFLNRLAGDSTLVLVLEDIHWADESSLFVLDYIARNICDKRILIVCTARPSESETRQAFGGMAEEGTGKLIRLESLEPESMKAILDAECRPNDFPGDFTEKLLDRVGGNPFFLIETLRQMTMEGSIRMENGIHKLVKGEYSLPRSVQDVVGRRLQALEPDALAVSEYAACIGRIFRREAAVSLRTVQDATGSLDKLGEQRIVILNNESGEFTHALLQEVIYSDIGPRWKSLYHRSLGEYYEKAYAERLDEVIYELAKHYWRTSDDEKAFNYLFMAGEKASNSYAPEQALIYYLEAEARMLRLRILDAGKKLALDIGLGEVNAILGTYDRALEYFDRSMASANDPALVSRLYQNLVDVYTWKSDYEKAWVLCEEALSKARDDRFRCKLFNSMGRICIRRGDFDKAEELMEQCLELTGRTGDKKTEAMAEVLVGVINTQKGKFDVALEHYSKALAFEEANDNIFGIASTLNNMGLAYWAMGELAKAMDFHMRSLALKRKIGDKYSIAGSLINIGLVHYYYGDLDKAEELYNQSLDIKQKLGDKYGLSLIHCYLGMTQHQRGNLEKALEHFAKVREMTESTRDKFQVADLDFNEGYLHLTFGNLAAAEERLDATLRLAGEIKAYNLVVSALYRLAEVSMERSNLEEARERIARAVEITKENIGNFDADFSTSVEARLAWLIGDFPGAEKIYKLGIENMTKIGKKRDAAILIHGRGEMLASAGRSGNAMAELEVARSMFRDMGMAHWEGKCAALLEKVSPS